jgi:hypothetical protein
VRKCFRSERVFDSFIETDLFLIISHGPNRKNVKRSVSSAVISASSPLNESSNLVSPDCFRFLDRLLCVGFSDWHAEEPLHS